MEEKEEYIDFIFVNCCLILNNKSVKIFKKNILQVEIFKCTLSICFSKY